MSLVGLAGSVGSVAQVEQNFGLQEADSNPLGNLWNAASEAFGVIASAVAGGNNDVGAAQVDDRTWEA